MDLQPAVKFAESAGRMIYLYDKAAALATDVLLAKTTEEEREGIGGYLTFAMSTEDRVPVVPMTFETTFFSRGSSEENLARPRFRVRQAITPGAKPEFEVCRPDERVTPSFQRMIKARETAIASLGEIVQPMNPIVLGGVLIKESGPLVYLLAGTPRDNVMVLGCHYQVLLSDDGSQVVRKKTFSKTCLEVDLAPAQLSSGLPEGSTLEAVNVTHLVSSTPVETHVIGSLQHRMPIYVSTDRGLWLVDGAKITFLGPTGK